MAKINNQEVMQKLIDELKLYPGKDMIPSELADKILAVYQVNEQAINFEEEGDLREIVDLTANDSDKTFTVPTGKKWDIKNLHLVYTSTADVGNRTLTVVIKDGSGNYIFVGGTETDIAASKTRYITFIPIETGWATDLVTATAGWDLGDGLTGFEILFPFPLTLLEDSTIRIYDKAAIAAAADDMSIHMLVRESDFVNKFT